MKSVMLSIKPRFCELIASGKKTIEIRKTKPKIDNPFKCYVYCCKQNGSSSFSGKVIGEFICDGFGRFYPRNCGLLYLGIDGEWQISDEEVLKYFNGTTAYGWHISDLVIYDKPKELIEFFKPCKHRVKSVDKSFDSCNFKQIECDFQKFDYNPDGSINDCFCGGYEAITRPPQSWCYVEEVEDK